MTARVMETAEALDRYVLVERERLLAVLRELNLGSSGLADDATALRIGRLTGARMMLFGAYQIVAGQMRLDLRLVDVETSLVLSTAEQTVASATITARLNGAEVATRELLDR
jgi:curli biogenesis system outer membrane secretion channel CsgG